MSKVPVARPIEFAVPEGMTLGGALLTTYDPPEPDVLLDDYLPAWLGMSRRPSGDGLDLPFRAERESLLRKVRDGIVILHRPGTNRPGHWLWNHVQPLPMECCQHAKVWLFHWLPNSRSGREQLQIVVSSLNLTKSARAEQTQSMWSATVPIEATTPTSANRKRWGGLHDILEALPKKISNAYPKGSGPRRSAEQSCLRFSDLLGRAKAPKGVTFVASIPLPTAKLPQEVLAAALKGKKISAAKILAPFVGPWSSEGLQAWCDAVVPARKARRLRILWQQHHESSRWMLEHRCTPAGLTVHGFQTGLFEGHTRDDPRWVHAKVYEFSAMGGAGATSLITSANFTAAAWGDSPARKGMRAPRNFELGVLVKGRGFAFSNNQPAAIAFPDTSVRSDDSDGVTATWDGRYIAIETTRNLGQVRVRRAGATYQRAPALKGGLRHLKWPESKGVPVELEWLDGAGDGSCEIWSLVSVKGDDGNRGDPDIPDGQRLALETAVLEERYGGAALESVVDAEGKTKTSAKKRDTQPQNTNYGLRVIELARDRGRVIDTWKFCLKRAADGQRSSVLGDGRRLVELWGKKMLANKVGGADFLAHKVASDELEGRLRITEQD